ncbi:MULTISPECIES: glucan biosynthesis protein [Hyphomicrobium]|jgi:glucans biosynthesis protein|uniref:glucan biosynthesis protein n=1 Tax=Hyphomicrobium TaxID=81 RepID=UPI0022EBDEA8|nr:MULTISPECIES: glucan biosynthesis protein [Hyphomicrobium]WBT36607.1 glucan biosynthesis protein [Hyphomicrobium sp. DMF-1]HML43116.1 glucan biosynthesis protein [Hyphomicrobium zavarzinii]
MSDDPGMGSGPNRRRVLIGAGATAVVAALAEHVLGLSPAFAGAAADQTNESFAADHVRKLAEELSAREFVKPRLELPEPFNALTAEQYRDIRFRSEASVWRGENLDYEVQLLALGWLYETPVEVWIVEGGKARSLKADSASFAIGPSIEKAPDAAPFGFSGFRVSGTLNRADALDEFVAFQGASYFKAVGRGQQYGLSARGLAINTARPGGEEFPVFRAFWIEKPAPGASEILIHALLDSESVAGAYRFVIRPGSATVIDVEGILYPRRSLTHVGLAPLTSMYFHGPAQRRIDNDYRPAVHNSEGLAVINGHGERLWRPLANPKMLQTSAFVDKDLKGFGLVQRDRSFAGYEDLEARYDRRPSAWVEPDGSWGDGYVELIEIPIAEEIHDNIVAYWKPAKPLEPGKAYKYGYRMYWDSAVPAVWSGAWTHQTHVGATRNADTILFVVDFAGPAARDARELPVADLLVSAGTTANLSVQRHPEISGLRVKFELNTAGTELIELRLSLKLAGQLISENWLYRWTRA